MESDAIIRRQARLFWAQFWSSDRAVSAEYKSAGRDMSGYHAQALVENAEAEIEAFAKRAVSEGIVPEAAEQMSVELLARYSADKRAVARAWPAQVREVLERELTRAQAELEAWIAAGGLRGSVVPSSLSPTTIDAPKDGWTELWQGPMHFRATFDRGQFGPGHTLERMEQYADDGATAHGRHERFYRVHVDPADGAVVISWNVGPHGNLTPAPVVRNYHLIGQPWVEQLRGDAALRDKHFSFLRPELRGRAPGAYTLADNVRGWLEREFLTAVQAGVCEIWARIGSPVAPFAQVPADVFHSYKVTSWGYGVPGGGRADLQGSPPLFAVHVAPGRQTIAARRAPGLEQKPLPEPRLLKWWATLTKPEREQSQEQLLALCRAAFPSNFISRDRIRALTPDRKRGRKSIRDKRSA
jgi:hypothetical protein